MNNKKNLYQKPAMCVVMLKQTHLCDGTGGYGPSGSREQRNDWGED